MTPVVAVRAEYQALVDGLPALMAPFGATISGAELDDVRVLMAAMERVDATLDPIRDAAARRAFGDAVVTAFDDSEALVGRDVATAMRALLEVVGRRGVRDLVRDLVREALDNTERMRTTRDVATYLACVEREGELTVELALRFLAPSEGAVRFARFLRAIAPVANLADKLADARADFAEGSLSLRPSVGLHAHLAARLVAGVPRAIARHPDRPALARWSLRWLRELVHTAFTSAVVASASTSPLATRCAARASSG